MVSMRAIIVFGGSFCIRAWKMTPIVALEPIYRMYIQIELVKSVAMMCTKIMRAIPARIKAAIRIFQIAKAWLMARIIYEPIAPPTSERAVSKIYPSAEPM